MGSDRKSYRFAGRVLFLTLAVASGVCAATLLLGVFPAVGAGAMPLAGSLLAAGGLCGTGFLLSWARNPEKMWDVFLLMGPILAMAFDVYVFRQQPGLIRLLAGVAFVAPGCVAVWKAWRGRRRADAGEAVEQPDAADERREL